MKKLLVVLLATASAAALPAGVAAAASPAFRLAIVHVVRGCHVWKTSRELGPSARITVTRGTRLEIRVSCPMDFDFAQAGGPRIALGNPRSAAGTIRTIVFKRPGVYRLIARNVQSAEELGLQTLGETNLLTLTVVVR